jgi:hypothetical protein
MCDGQSWCLRTSVARSAGNARQAARSIARLMSEEDLRTNDSRQQFRRTSARYACPPCVSPERFLEDAVVAGCSMVLQLSNHSKCVDSLLKEDKSSLPCESSALMMLEAHPRRSSANVRKRSLVKLSFAFLHTASSETAGALVSASSGLNTQDASHESVSQTIANTAAELNKQLVATAMQTKHRGRFCFRR